MSMTYEEIFERAKSVIGEENIDDYRPARIEGAPNTFFEMRRCIPNTITIWLKNGDWIMYQHKTDCAVTIDAVPVVRCKDCRHSYFASNRVPSEQCLVCDKNGSDIEPDEFCADGERRDGGETDGTETH